MKIFKIEQLHPKSKGPKILNNWTKGTRLEEWVQYSNDPNTNKNWTNKTLNPGEQNIKKKLGQNVVYTYRVTRFET